MIAKSVKFKCFSCFQNNWVGFDKFKPITVIIGRNNTGKSQLLGMVENLTKLDLWEQEYTIECSGILDHDFLHKAFPSGVFSRATGQKEWDTHGVHLMNVQVEWNLDHSKNNCEISLPNSTLQSVAKIQQEREEKIRWHLREVKCPLSNKVFRRLLADRDIIPEDASNTLELASNGQGATNIIRRFINSSNLSEKPIQEDLLQALNEIFDGDGNFRQITIRQHDETDRGGGLWEVFLDEPKKILIPLGNSGSELKTVLLVLLNLLVIPKIEKRHEHEYVFAFEELENNLHPALLRRLFKYIYEYVEKYRCHIFFTTHSNVALDYFSTLPESQIIHVSHDGESATSKTVACHFDRVDLMNELGAKPSDLLQANGIIWLEGPSDRIYINKFIELFSEGKLREGSDYQCAYYGGSVLAKCGFEPPEDTDQDSTNLLRLNNNIAVICDGDRTAESGPGSGMKKRVQRINSQVNNIPKSFLWITDAKEIENYIPGTVWSSVYQVVNVPNPEKYDSFPSTTVAGESFVEKHLSRKTFDKCDFAMKAVQHLTKELLADRFELSEKMISFVKIIETWNR